MALETSETLFTVLSVANYCGYDAELAGSDPLRNQIRSEITEMVRSSADLVEAAQILCDYYSERRQADSSRTLAQYVSLALYMNPPPALDLKVKEAEMPPDAVGIIGIVPLIQNFYKQAGLHAIWQRHAQQYAALTEQYHGPLAKMMFDTEIYLKLPSSGYLGHGFTIYLDPLEAPGQTNARNYGSDYFIVISPGTNTSLKLDLIRHTYLHYLLDPLTLKYPTALKRMEPLLVAVKTAPLDDSFKSDVSLLSTECLIRAIEARTIGGAKTSEADRQKMVADSMAQGFILTGYFYNALATFEKDPAGLRTVLPDLLAKVDVGAEVKRANQIQFASSADSELLHLSQPSQGKLLSTAEQRLNAGDKETAQKLAQQAIDQKIEDQGRALFILAEVAVTSSDMEGARNYFLQALEKTEEPKVVAWSHIYLGRIFDLQDNRDAALDHYKAAVTASVLLPDAKAAAERGIQKAYEPPSRPQPKD